MPFRSLRIGPLARASRSIGLALATEIVERAPGSADQASSWSASARVTSRSRTRRLAHREERLDRLGEDLGVAVDVGCGRRRRHERHVVERGHQDPPVHRPEVEEPLELRVGVRPLLGAGPRRVGHEVVLGAGAEPGHVPRHAGSRRTPLTPASHRSASGIIRSKASAVRTSPSVARVAASDRA